MGANLITHVCDTDDVAAVNRQFKDLQEHDRDTKGLEGYSGGWHELVALRYHDLQLTNRNEAYDWLEELEDKWICHVVSFNDDGKLRWILGGWSPT